MACRIVWCTVFIEAYFRRVGVPFETSALLPNRVAFLAAAVANQAARRLVAATTRAGGPLDQLLDLSKIAVVAVPLVAVMYVVLAPLHKYYRCTMIGLFSNMFGSVQRLLGAPIPTAVLQLARHQAQSRLSRDAAVPRRRFQRKQRHQSNVIFVPFLLISTSLKNAP